MSDAAIRLADEIIAGLDAERALALDGAFEALDAAVTQRDAQIERLLALGLAAARAIAPRLEAIRDAAARNMALMQAALDGAAAGRRRVREIASAGARLATYDASGAPVERAAGGGSGRRV